MTAPIGTIYIIEFSRPLSHARYYVGWTFQPVDERLKQHEAGQGAKITAAAVAAGIKLRVIYTVRGTRSDERRIKIKKNTPRYVASLRRRGVIAPKA